MPCSVRRLAVAVLAAAVAAAQAMPASGAESSPPLGKEQNKPPEVAYELTISGVPEDDLMKLLEETSQLKILSDKPPSTLAGLRRRAEGDVQRLLEALRSRGFYDAEITPRIDGSVSPVKVELIVDTGVLYLLSAFDIDYGDVDDRRGLIDDIADLGDESLHLGMPAEGAKVVTAQEALLQRLAEHGRPLARVVDRKVTVDHADATMQVNLKVDPGSWARFGNAEFRGVTSVDPAYLQRLVPWKPGTVYDQREVDQLRRRLWDTELFDTVTLLPADAVAPGGAVPVAFELNEGPPRTISAGINYSTDRQLGADVSWTHRNLFGQQESLAITAAADFVEQALTTEFRKPNVGRFGQTILADGVIKRQDTDAYRERAARVFVGVEREFAEIWSGRIGPSLDYSVLDDNNGQQTFLILGLPASVTRDTTDNPLDPTEGTRLTVGLTPSIGTLERNLAFLTQELGGSAYLSLSEEDRVILAGRFRLASIVGAATDELPASKRLYAGGGGSVRGFTYQSLGPLDAENDPLGGRSAVELGFETRFRVTDDIGLVPFIEGGNVYDDQFPTFDDELRWAAGLGVRYFTRIGPMRVDFAFPLNGREGVDNTFEFYVSLGQAF